MFNQTNWIQFQFSAFKVFILIPREIFFIHYRTDYTCSQVNRIRLQQTCIYQHHHMWSSRALLIPAPSPSKNPKCNYSICSPLRAFSYEQCKNVQSLFESRRRDTRPRITTFHNWGKKRDEDFLIHFLLCRSEDVKKGKHNRTIIKKNRENKTATKQSEGGRGGCKTTKFLCQRKRGEKEHEESSFCCRVLLPSTTERRREKIKSTTQQERLKHTEKFFLRTQLEGKIFPLRGSSCMLKPWAARLSKDMIFNVELDIVRKTLKAPSLVFCGWLIFSYGFGENFFRWKAKEIK